MADESRALSPEQRVMLESEKLGERMNELMREWEGLTIQDLIEITFRVFMADQRRTTYLDVLLWAVEFPKGFPKPMGPGGRNGMAYVDVNPIHSKTFKKTFLTDLGNDIAMRLHASGDLLSSLTYLNAGLAKRSVVKPQPQLLNEQFKRSKKQAASEYVPPAVKDEDG